jgi:hypothetical protein
MKVFDWFGDLTSDYLERWGLNDLVEVGVYISF